MTGHEPRLELDLLAVRLDDEELDALARRQPRAPDHDVYGLLAALSVEVDAGLPELLALPLPHDETSVDAAAHPDAEPEG